jgi:hypothetical protein
LATIPWIVFGIFFNDETNIGLMIMMFRFLKVNKGELIVGK